MIKYIFLVLVSISALHASELKPQCARPIKPTAFDDNRAVRRYNDDANRYQACMNDFIREHRAIAERETKAVNDAIHEWNDFASGGSGTHHKKSSGIKAKTGSTDGHHTVGKTDPTMFYKNLKF